MIKRIFKRIGLLLAALIIVFAILSTIARALTPFLAQYHTEIEQFVSELIEQPVKIEKIETGWSWFQPKMMLSDVQVFNDQKTSQLLRVQNLTVGISLWSSLRHWQWRPGLLRVSGANVTLRQEKDGQILVDGLPWKPLTEAYKIESTATNLDMLSWLFSEGKFLFEHLNIRWIGRNGTVIPIKDLKLAIVNSGNYHHIEGQIGLAQATPSHLHLITSFTGSIKDFKHWQGEGYIDAKDVLLAQWLNPFSLAGVNVTHGTLNGKFWFKVNESQLSEINTQFSLNRLNLLNKTTKQNQLLQSFAANATWQREGLGWQLMADKIQLRQGDLAWVENKLSWQSTPYKNGATQQKIYVHYLRLNELSSWLIWEKLLPEDIKTWFIGLQPSGELRHVYWQNTPKEQPDRQEWYGFAEFKKLAWKSWNHIPGLDGLEGQIQFWPKIGRLELKSDAATLHAPRMLLQPISLNKVTTAIDWEHQSDGWHVILKNTQIKNNDISLQVDGTAHFTDFASSPDVNLKGSLLFTDLSELKYYLPSKIMSPTLGKWLQQAFVGGQLKQGDIVLKGNLNDFPFDNNKGVFSVNAKLVNTELNYDPEWPAAKDLTATVQFKQRDMIANVDSAKLLGSSLQDIKITIPQMGRDNDILYLKGAVATDSSEGIRFIQQSELKNSLPALTKLPLQGPMDLKLDLVVPLDINPEHRSRVNGQVKLTDNQLVHEGLTLDKLAGKISFSETSIDSENLKGTLFGKESEIAIKTIKENTDITFNSQLDAKALKKYTESPLVEAFNGVVNYQVKTTVAHQGNKVQDIEVTSDLAGLAISLPSPLKKTEDQKIPLKVKVSGLESNLPLFQWRYGNRLEGTFQLERTKEKSGKEKNTKEKYDVQNGLLRLGKIENLEQLSFPSSNKGLSIVGELDRISLTEWFDWLVQSSETNGVTMPQVSRIDLKIKTAEWLGQSIANLAIKLKPATENWEVELLSSNINGKITIPKELQRGMQVRFSKLALKKFTSPSKTTISVDPTRFLPLTLSIADFSYDDMAFGRVELKGQPQKDGWRIERLTMESPTLALAATGQWRKKQTNIQGSIDIKGLAETLSAWRLPPAIESRSGEVQFNLNWPGAPYVFATDKLNGQLFFRLRRGSITQISPEAEKRLGFGKLLSFLSLQNLPRSLTSGFSSLSQKGFGFDVFSGNFNLNRGIAQTQDTKLEGQIASANVEGNIDLARRQYALMLQIIPQVNMDLPIPIVAASIAGTPIAGAAVWLASTIVGKTVGKSSGTMYKVTGPWTNPVVEEVAKADRRRR